METLTSRQKAEVVRSGIRFRGVKKPATTCLFALVTAAVLPAQKLPLEDGRVLQVHDLRAVHPPDAHQRDLSRYTDFARLAARFVEPPLGEEDGVELLGDYRLAVLGTPAQCAWVERLVQRSTRLRGAQIAIETSLLELDGAQFDEHLAEFFAGHGEGDRRCRVGDSEQVAKRVGALQAGGARFLSTPRVLVENMRRALVSAGESVPYVSDYEIEMHEGKPIARAVSRELFDGIEVDLLAASIENGVVHVDCAMWHATVLRPLPEAIVEVAPDVAPGLKKIVQLPRTRSAELAEALVLPKGSTAAVAVRRADGRWLLALVTATLRA